jgi:hypothetical protein
MGSFDDIANRTAVQAWSVVQVVGGGSAGKQMTLKAR